MIFKTTCPNCYLRYLEWDSEIGQLYCPGCDTFYSEEDIKNIRAELEERQDRERQDRERQDREQEE